MSFELAGLSGRPSRQRARGLVKAGHWAARVMSCVELSRARDLLVVRGGSELIRAGGDEVVVRRLLKG